MDYSEGDVYDHFPHLRGLSGIAAIRGGFRDVFLGQAPGQVADLRRILAERPADAILCDGLVFGAGLAHELGGPPWAVFSDGPLPVPDAQVPPFGPALPYRAGPLGRLRNRVVATLTDRIVFGELDTVLGRIRADLALPPERRHAIDTLVSPYLLAQGCTPGFDYPRGELPSQVHWVGALRPDPPRDWTPPPWWEELDGSRPVVHVTQGSIRPDGSELLAPTLRALAREDVLVVATTAGSRLDDVPANARVASFVPYDALLDRADVLVTNGGYSGVTLALHHGVPIVQAGTTEEKSEIGRRIEWSGVGVRLGTSRPSAEQVRTGVRRVLAEPRFRDAARRVQGEMAAHDGPRETAALLERLAATGRPVTRAHGDSRSTAQPEPARR